MDQRGKPMPARVLLPARYDDAELVFLAAPTFVFPIARRMAEHWPKISKAYYLEYWQSPTKIPLVVEVVMLQKITVRPPNLPLRYQF